MKRWKGLALGALALLLMAAQPAQAAEEAAPATRVTTADLKEIGSASCRERV